MQKSNFTVLLTLLKAEALELSAETAGRLQGNVQPKSDVAAHSSSLSSSALGLVGSKMLMQFILLPHRQGEISGYTSVIHCFLWPLLNSHTGRSWL